MELIGSSTYFLVLFFLFFFHFPREFLDITMSIAQMKLPNRLEEKEEKRGEEEEEEKNATSPSSCVCVLERYTLSVRFYSM